MVNLVGMFKQFRDVPALWRSSKIELVSRSGSNKSFGCSPAVSWRQTKEKTHWRRVL